MKSAIGGVIVIMPKRMPTTCSSPGCPNLAYGRYCEQHAKEKAQRCDQERGTAASRGYNSKWQKYRRKYLYEHPLCVECERVGKLKVATVVDHIAPHKGDHKLFWDQKNHQSLCGPCHNKKTAKEDGGFGNKRNG